MLKTKYRILPPRVQSTLQMMDDLRFSYAVVSSGLILLGFFWNNLTGFTWQYIALILSIFFANVFTFVINDFYDAEQDSLDPVKQARNVFCSPETSKLGKGVLYASLGLSIFFGGIVSPPILIIILLFNILGFVYSAPPIKLRSRRYWDWIFVFLWKGLIITAGYIYFFGIERFAGNFFIYGTLAIILLFSLIGQLDNQIRDFTVDKTNNSFHTVQHLGYGTAIFLKKSLLVFFFTFSFVFCYFFELYITMILILLNGSLYYFVPSDKHHIVPDFANQWVVVLFLEHALPFFSYRQQLLFSAWVVVMVALAVLHVKRKSLFEKDARLME